MKHLALPLLCLLTLAPAFGAEKPASSFPPLAPTLRPATPAVPSADHGAEGEGDVVIGPTYKDAPELTPRDGVPKGTIRDFIMKSEESKIYPGLNGHYDRKVQVYVPPQYVAGTAAPFIIVQDGTGYTRRMSTALDNLIADKKVPAMIAIMIDSGGGDSKGSERGLEYDTVSARYSDFIETEVLPRVARECNVAFTKDPEGRATMGGSSGAACAWTMAWFHPDHYRRVLSYSGTFVDQQSPTNPESLHGAWEYHEHLIPQSPAKPIRVWLHVSENDNGHDRDEASLHNWPMANERMAAALKAKGYHYRYVYSQASGHVDGKVVGQTLPEALVWLWHGYPLAAARR